MKRFRLPVIGLLMIALTALAASAAARSNQDLNYQITAKDGRLVREVTGEVTSTVAGVPAEPVDSFVWDGDGVVPIEGSVRVNIDPIANTGTIEAHWTDENGEWTYTQTAFAPPGHPTGLQIGPSAGSTVLIEDDPVTTNVYLHGDTTAGGPVLPTVFNYLATWGPAEVTLNGEPFDNPFDGPVPLWVGHTMTAVGVRNENGEVLTTEGGIFNMGEAGNGVVYNDEIEFHLVFHDAPNMDELTNNVPPPLAFFYHVTFQDVKVKIRGRN